MVGDLGPAVAGGLAVLAIGFPLAEVLRNIATPAPILIALVGIVGVMAHVAVLRTCFPAVWSDLSGFTRRLVPARLHPRRWRAVPSTSAS
jgi:xanthosine utilization system XapX-like protein